MTVTDASSGPIDGSSSALTSTTAGGVGVGCTAGLGWATVAVGWVTVDVLLTVVVLCGVTVGEGPIVPAGAVVVGVITTVVS